MELSFETTTNVGLGYSNMADAFQSGREAAQMAKSQLPAGRLDVVLAFGPSTPSFQDFIEGVRLVTGEESLIGIPTTRVFTNEHISQEEFLVLILKSDPLQFSIASAETNTTNTLFGVTSLFSQFRQKRGNNRHQFDYHGVLYFDTNDDPHRGPLIFSEAGFESWVMGGGSHMDTKTPLICRDNIIQNGMAAVEFLSNSPVGLGTVNIAAFKDRPSIYQQSAKTAVRDALSQLENASPALGFLFLNFSLESISPQELKSMLTFEEPNLKKIPFIGLSMQDQFIRPLNRPLIHANETVSALVIPQ